MTVRSEARDGVGWITLDRPEVRNALDSTTVRALGEALDGFAATADLRVIVLTGAGKVFCAGADLRAMKSMREAGSDANRADALEMGGLFHRIAACPKPVVARVGGAAIGGGVGLMAACDIVVAVDTAHFQFSEVRLGLVPAVISPFCIRGLGAAVAKRLFLTGERIDAARAAALGLVDIVAAPEALDETLEGLLSALRAAGPQALVAAKELVDTVATMDRQTALAYTANLIASLREGEEAQQGMHAFLTKSPPPWMKN